jgi:hypothetical protein
MQIPKKPIARIAFLNFSRNKNRVARALLPAKFAVVKCEGSPAAFKRSQSPAQSAPWISP